MSDAHDESNSEPVLSPEQARIIGVLLEKERTTPADYPMTANAITRASNQTTSRSPVVSYDESMVQRELDGLKQAGLVRFVHSQSNRSTKFRHVVDEAWGLGDGELAVLCLLLLRGAQTPGELRTRAERLHSFASPAEVEATLEALADRQEPMVLQLERAPGQKDRRWVQLLTGAPSAEDLAVLAEGRPPTGRRGAVDEALVARVEALEAEVAELRSDDRRAAFGARGARRTAPRTGRRRGLSRRRAGSAQARCDLVIGWFPPVLVPRAHDADRDPADQLQGGADERERDRRHEHHRGTERADDLPTLTSGGRGVAHQARSVGVPQREGLDPR